MGKTTKRSPPGRTANGVKKTAALNKKIQNAAEVIAENLAGRKAGRPPKYHDGFCHIAEQQCIVNATNPNLGDMFGCSLSQIEEWEREHERFARAIQRGKERCDELIEEALSHRARGYTHPEEIVTYDTRRGRWTRAQTTKHYAPDTAAAFIWLKNRRSGKWKDRQPEDNGDGDAPPPVKVTIEFKDARKAKDEDVLEVSVTTEKGA